MPYVCCDCGVWDELWPKMAEIACGQADENYAPNLSSLRVIIVSIPSHETRHSLAEWRLRFIARERV